MTNISPAATGDITVSEMNHHRPIENNEHLVRVRVAVPNKLALELHKLKVIVVHLRDDLRRPVLRELRKLFTEVDCGLHTIPFSL